MRWTIAVFMILAGNLSFAQTPSNIRKLHNDLNETSVEGQAGIHNKLARAYRSENVDSSFFHAHRALNLATRHKDETEMALAHNNLSLAYFSSGDVSSCFDHLTTVESMAKDLKDTLVLLRAAETKARVLFYLEREGQSYETISEGLVYARAISDSSSIIALLNNLGIIKLAMGQPDDAIKQHRLAARLATSFGDSTLLGNALGSIGGAFSGKIMPDSALYYYKRSLRIWEALDNKESITLALFNLGRIYMNNDSLPQARAVNRAAINMGRKVGTRHTIALCQYNLGRAAMLEQDFELSKLYLDSALIDFKDLHSYSELSMTHFILSRVYDGQGLRDSSFVHFRLYHQFSDSANQVQVRQRINQVKWAREMQKKEDELATMAREKEQLNEKKRILEEKAEAEAQTNNLLIVVIVIALVLALVLVFAIRQKIRLLKQERVMRDLENAESAEKLEAAERIAQMEREKLDLEIAHKTRELSAITMQMLNKSEVIDNIQGELKKLKGDLENNVVDGKLALINRVRRMNTELNGMADLEKDWEQLKLHFNDVNLGFFEKLEQVHPELSQNDLKVCAYMYIKMSSKQIARVMNVSPDSVKKQRHRMRKKMGLEAQADIESYLHQLLAA